MPTETPRARSLRRWRNFALWHPPHPPHPPHTPHCATKQHLAYSAIDPLSVSCLHCARLLERIDAAPRCRRLNNTPTPTPSPIPTPTHTHTHTTPTHSLVHTPHPRAKPHPALSPSAPRACRCEAPEADGDGPSQAQAPVKGAEGVRCAHFPRSGASGANARRCRHASLARRKRNVEKKREKKRENDARRERLSAPKRARFAPFFIVAIALYLQLRAAHKNKKKL